MEKEQVKEQEQVKEEKVETTVSIEEFSMLKNEFNTLKQISESKDKTIETLLGKIENFAKTLTVSLENKKEEPLPTVKELLKDV